MAVRDLSAWRAIAVLAALACWAPLAAAEPPDLDAELQRLTTLLAGDFLSAPDGGAREGRPLHLRIRPVDPPAGRRFALYAEMRHDDADGELYRQRLYLFDESPDRGANLMQSLAFEDGATATRLVDEPTLVAQGLLALKPPMAAGCDTVWSADRDAFVGRVDPATCVITGKRGDQRRIESVTRIEAGSIGQLERGYDLDGRQLFGNPTDALHSWPRQR